MYKEFIKKCLDDLKRDKKTYCVDITQLESLKYEYSGILKWKYIKDLKMFLVEVEEEIEGGMNKVVKKLVNTLTDYGNTEKFVEQVCDLLLKANLITEEEASDIKIKHYDNRLEHM